MNCFPKNNTKLTVVNNGASITSLVTINNIVDTNIDVDSISDTRNVDNGVATVTIIRRW